MLGGTPKHISDATGDALVETVETLAAGGQPFYLQFHTYAVHGPVRARPDLRAAAAERAEGRQQAEYLGFIAGVDETVGRLLAVLADPDGDGDPADSISEDTLVLFLGDNGSDAPLGPTHDHASSFPLRAKKGTHYEGGMRVPFIAAWAKPAPTNRWQQQLPIAAGAIQQQLGTVMDIYPTVLALAGAKPPADHPLDGFDLAAQLTGTENPERRERFLMHFPHSHRSSYFTAFRNGDWKLIYHYLPDQNPAKIRYELFHLRDDPYEKQNLAATEPAMLRQMTAAMMAALDAEQALFPVASDGTELRPVVPDG
jgi:arylsulfatase A-like enzyme